MQRVYSVAKIDFDSEEVVDLVFGRCYIVSEDSVRWSTVYHIEGRHGEFSLIVKVRNIDSDYVSHDAGQYFMASWYLKRLYEDRELIPLFSEKDPYLFSSYEFIS